MMRKIAARTMLIAALVGLTSTAFAASSAAAAPQSTNRCQILHELYQQGGSMHAHVEDPCEQRSLSLDVYRNGVVFAEISGGFAVSWDYDCVCSDLTTWRTNWGDEIIANCA